MLVYDTVAEGTWGMKRLGANEDTSSSPVISVLDAKSDVPADLVKLSKAEECHAR